MENNNEMLKQIITEVGMKYGFSDINAEFTEFRDFKVKWTRSYKWIELQISDYLRNAPEDIIRSLAGTIFGKIKGIPDTGYSDEVCDYVTSKGFLNDNQPLYIERLKGISRESTGDNIDLEDSYNRLVEKGLVEKDSDIQIRWGPKTVSKTVGNSSVLMKTVVLNRKLDSRFVSEEAIDYALYSMLCRIHMGFNHIGSNYQSDYRRIIELYPDWISITRELEKIGISL